MRSRFSAFKLGKIDYLIATHHPSKQTANENRELQEAIKNTQWLKLYILDAPEDDGNKGHVEFHAIFSHRGDDQAIANQASSNKDIGLLHERSNFIYEDNRWLYLDGEIFDTPMPSHYFPSRNDLCWCSSGKKYKKCCGS